MGCLRQHDSLPRAFFDAGDFMPYASVEVQPPSSLSALDQFIKCGSCSGQVLPGGGSSLECRDIRIPPGSSTQTLLMRTSRASCI